jgi:hypothetical protein
MLAFPVVQFGSWIPLGPLLGPAPSPDALPDNAGLFQLRVEQGLLRYPHGKSAMVAYGAGSNVGAALRDFLAGPAGARAQQLGPLLVRFAAPDPHGSPAEHLQRLHERFESQFGSLPLSQVEPPATEKATEK